MYTLLCASLGILTFLLGYELGQEVQIMEDNVDRTVTTDKDYVFMNDGTPVEYDEDNQE